MTNQELARKAAEKWFAEEWQAMKESEANLKEGESTSSWAADLERRENDLAAIVLEICFPQEQHPRSFSVGCKHCGSWTYLHRGIYRCGHECDKSQADNGPLEYGEAKAPQEQQAEDEGSHDPAWRVAWKIGHYLSSPTRAILVKDIGAFAEMIKQEFPQET